MTTSKIASLLVLLTVTAAGIAALLLPSPTPAAPPSDTAHVWLICTPGWRGSGGGSYGGVSFSVSCEHGRDHVRLTGVADTTYSVRMGAESEAVAVDCLFTGDAASVSESCAGVGLLIR